jgi:hypothetical protein
MVHPIPHCSVEGCRFREVPGQGVCVEHGGVTEEPRYPKGLLVERHQIAEIMSE